MIEWPPNLPRAGGVSLVEARLGRLLRPVVIVDFEPHARPATPSLDTAPEATASAAAPGVELPGVDRLRALLEAGAGHLAQARAAYREQCRQAAVQARKLAAFARCRPAALLDRPEAEVGAAAAATRAARPAALGEVSEWAVDEVAAAMGLSGPAAGALLVDAVTLVEQLPATLAALEDGRVDWAKARMLAEVLAPLTDDDVRGGVEARLLARAEGRTLTQLKASARRAVLGADAGAAAARLAAAIRDRSVRVCPGEDGMASLTAALPLPVARACYRALEAYAEACAGPGDERTKAQRMLDCLPELILRPGEHGLPPVQVQLTVVAGVDTLAGGDEPGEVDGVAVPAHLVRELAYTLGLLPPPAPTTDPAATTDTAPTTDTATGTAPGTDVGAEPPRPATESDTPPGSDPASGGERGPTGPPEPTERSAAVAAAAEALARAGNQQAAADLAALLGLRSVTGTALASVPTIAIVEEISGQLLALTTGGELRRTATCHQPACRTGARPCTHPPCGAGLGPPADSIGYTPGDKLAAFTRARDRRCRFPGCRAPAIRCDLDHNIPWPAGPTSHANLCCLCRHHHRLSHQAPGWRLHRLPDGGLRWTLPGGQTRTTYPPRYGTDENTPPERPEVQPPEQPAPIARRYTIMDSLRGRPVPPGTVDNHPPPF